MNIELVEFFGIKKDLKNEKLVGSLRVKLPDLGIEILGIICKCNKDAWFFSMPSKIGEKDGKSVRYPHINFLQTNMKKDFFKNLQQIAPEWILDKVFDKKNPTKFPPLSPKKLTKKKFQCARPAV